MTLTEILPAVQQLPLEEKLKLIRLLAAEVETDSQTIFPLQPYKVYYLATPYNLSGAGKVLMAALEESDQRLN